ncbi:transmembrane protein FAM155B-like [Corvus kubaryi]|uniref:transmembrane protein FAM155B-like n=1 Tax=Corvus kubaryi TaxID=68294 RepID=UPI001C049A08|nr:transmembrane protein FAM155B-like [Corvus kubaryi]
MERRPSWAVGRGETAAPPAAPGPLPPPKGRPAGPRGCAGRGSQCWAQGAPGRGAEPAPSLPSWRSLQLADDRSRAAEHLRRALPYLCSPQTPLREAAVRFIGIAGRHLRRQKEELQLICEALQALRRDDSPSLTGIFVQLTFEEKICRTAFICLIQKTECP